MTPSKPALPRAFIKLAWANLAAQSAEQISLAAVPIVAVLALGAGAGEIGLLASVQTLPFLLLSIPLGLLADRVSRRRLMIAAEMVRAGALIGLIFAAATGTISLPLLAVLGFLGATGTVAFSVAAPALVPALVDRESLGFANSRLELARSTAFAAGPALAGTLVAWAGGSMAFVLAAILSVMAVGLLWRVPEPDRVLATKRNPLLELRDGAQLVWSHAYLRPILLTSVIWNTSWFVLQAAYVPYAIRTLGLSPSTLGITLACYGAGMVVGAFFAQRIIAAMPFGTAVQIGPTASVIAAALIAATIWVPSAILVALGFFVFGVGPILWTITSTTLRQSVTPNAMLGRVSAIMLTVGFGARPIGAGIGALVGSRWGEPACLLLALVGFCLQAAMIYGSKIKRLHSLADA